FSQCIGTPREDTEPSLMCFQRSGFSRREPMRVLSQLKNKNYRLMLLSAAVGATMICLQANHANAAAINVALANDSTTTTNTGATNSGITPITYTPPTATIAAAPGQT